MGLHKLPKVIHKKKKRLGRGYGTGKGAKSGRGTKGQKKRSKVPLGFEGGQLELYKRLPFLRGKGRNKSLKKKPIVINVKNLNLLPKNSNVTIENLIKHHLVKEDDAKKFGIKILGDGELAVSLTVKLPVSKGAKKKIEKAGGRVVVT